MLCNALFAIVLVVYISSIQGFMTVNRMIRHNKLLMKNDNEITIEYWYYNSFYSRSRTLANIFSFTRLLIARDASGCCAQHITLKKFYPLLSHIT